MSIIVPRTCTEISAENANQHREKEPRSLEEFQDVSAYVLLGDPGAGKTTAFKTECKKLREKACLITARDFLTFNPQSHPEWCDKTLFIDGLDEIRVGANDARTPFDQIRGRLDELGKPHFRLSCREADWLGANDRRHLESVSPDSKVTVLRLDPLTDSDIADVLNDRSDIGDAQTFMAAAKERGVEGLLANPQTLKMLADVVAQGGGWPKSRKETFDMACRQTIREHNEDHQAAQESKSPPAPDQILDAAGRLCAVQLISGAAGYALHGQVDEEYPALDQCNYNCPKALWSALATKLFKGASDNRFAPIHRHIAEFLGALHLAEAIKRGLPSRRVVSLIAGEDGTVVTEMRGLSAWLAAHCKDARADLIKRDPIGVGLYGDIREFSTDEKRALLESLNREGIRLASGRRIAAAFGAIAMPDMEPALKKILNDSNRDRDHQMFTDFVLHFLREGGPLPNLSELLLEIVRDDTRWPRVNYAALSAFSHNCLDSEDRTVRLKELLADIQNERVPDPDNEFLGALLTQLYPHDLTPSEVWDYLSEKGNLELIGRHRWFWEFDLLKKSSDEQVAELLDNLNDRLPRLQSVLDVRHLDGLPLKLLARGLKVHGGKIKPERLYDWLSVGCAEIKDGFLVKEAIQEIRLWLEQHSEVQKKVILEGLSRCPESDEVTVHAFSIQRRLYGAKWPPDFGLWCLKQAIAMMDTKPQVAEYLFVCAVRVHTDPNVNEGLSLDVLQEYARNNEKLEAHLAQLLTPPSTSPRQQEWREQDRQFTEERNQKEEKRLAYIRSNETALRENRAAPSLLHQMAYKYFERIFHFGDDAGLKGIEDELLGDCGLIDATLQGFRGTIDREDVPDIKEILSLKEKNHIHYLSFPFLAGLAELERTTPEDASQWDDCRIRKAVAFYYCTAHASYRPRWYQRLLAARPEIVAEVQVQVAVSEFRSGGEYIYKLYELAHDKAHAQVAKHATLPLLRVFPTRCKLKQIQSLDYLIWAALQHTDRASLQELIEKKLFLKSMNDAQRVHWLAVSLIVSPRAYNDLLNFVQGHERRSLHLAEFFFSDDRILPSLPELRVEIWELLTRLVGNYAGPDQWVDPSGPTIASRLVRDLIQHLAASPTKDASDALDRLLADPALSRWRDVLSQAQNAQQVTWRDAVYRHLTIEQVCQTLNGGPPANPADLAALVMDQLDEVARKIRGGPTSDWHQYWNVDQYNRPTCEKPEDACRDNLLSDLQNRLEQLDIDAQPEGQYANKKRSDIRVYFRGSNVPVEIKKNSHQKLWSSLRDQLIAKYTSTPGTDGYGIYLVFWFGKDRTPPPPSGTRPANAKELKKRLEATLSPNEARKISICVIDVSRPD